MSLPHRIIRDSRKELFHPFKEDRLQTCQLPVHLDPVDSFVEARRAWILSNQQGSEFGTLPRSR